ncbi:hypothetical protein [Roseobacter sp. GAI101]|uniref:hypothetical protein n=1 Tax=Roseobacter sp. (strain GAI101) TaxID=391589 RepID=UPI0002E6E533|nr:hypothetical protein [Roseobacter sp. GAI101]
MTETPKTSPKRNDLPPSLSVDWEAYGVMLDASDMPEAQKRELIQTLWSIVTAFVDLGFGVHPVQQVCGQADDPLSDVPPDLISLWLSEQTSETQQEDTCKKP